jgi:hyaluronoglucosaminidase
MIQTPSLGIIEGYFGRPWPMPDRKAVITALAGQRYSFFHYAPKADAFLRRRWREPHPDADFAALADLAAHCRAQGVRFGVGLSPYELFRDFSGAARADFIAKVRALDGLGLDDLAILFDDMRGDLPDLAALQAEIVHCAMMETKATRVFTCPSYYTDDAVLDLVFGARPAGYLEDFGRRLNPRVQVYWTGEEVCAREYSPGHLRRVGEALGRKPTLWDNYPVNDGPRMSRFLHLRAFTGRPSSIGRELSGHAVNPALQPHLSMIPCLSLTASYAEGDRYQYMAAFRAAAVSVCGAELAEALERDLMTFQDQGLERLGERAVSLRAKYAAFDHPAAREIVGWLDGVYRITKWEIETG